VKANLTTDHTDLNGLPPIRLVFASLFDHYAAITLKLQGLPVISVPAFRANRSVQQSFLSPSKPFV
jgi:hypothetical protein